MGRVHYLLIDGYNIIYAWDNLKKLASSSMESARYKLISILQNYKGVKDYEIIIVFDAYRVIGGQGVIERHGNITVVYTSEAETADQYIERTSRELRRYSVTVATSDNLEQIIIIGSGAKRMSADELMNDIKETEKSIRQKIASSKPIKNNQLLDNLDPKTAEILDFLRLGK